MARHRVALNETPPSTVTLIKHGGRETEKLVLVADGISAMVNEDNSLTIHVYTAKESYSLWLSSEDVQSQRHVFQRWRELR